MWQRNRRQDTKNTQEMSRLQEKYRREIIPQLAKELGVKNHMAVPKVIKIIVNMGIGDAVRKKELLGQAREDLAKITGLTPSVREARAAVASFSIRRGMPVGLKVTLRGVRMYDFLDKLISVVLPRLRDFRGVSLSSFDKQGNYTLGIAEHTVFPEIDVGKSGVMGLEITIVTNTDSVDKSKRLLELLGIPFEKKND